MKQSDTFISYKGLCSGKNPVEILSFAPSALPDIGSYNLFSPYLSSGRLKSNVVSMKANAQNMTVIRPCKIENKAQRSRCKTVVMICAEANPSLE